VRLKNAGLVLLHRNTSLSLTILYLQNRLQLLIFDLLLTGATTSLTSSISVESQGLLGTLGNLMESGEERDGGIGLHHHSACELAHWPTSLLRDVDKGRVGYMGGFQNLAGHDAGCVVSNDTGHFCRSLQRDL